MIKRAVGLFAGLTVLMSACESSPAPAQFDANQVLHLVAPIDVFTLDPAKVHQQTVENSLVRNVFGGLYRFRDDLALEPDLAKGMPNISPDGLTWTFHLRTDARFSNGTPVKAADVLYSWNRVARLNEDVYGNASIFHLVSGYADVQSGRAETLSGLTKPDDYTVVARLTAPGGYWLVELGLWGAAVVDQEVVAAQGEDAWWTTPAGLIGTGPFRMTSRAPGRTLDFEPVANWWRGSTGRLKRVHVDVIADHSVAENGYKAGDFDILGYTPTDIAASVSSETIKTFRADSHLKGELRLHPWGWTAVMGFRREGRLGTDADEAMRRALSLALDRDRLATICFGGGICEPATGGLITKGLAGYLGDGADRNAKRDVGGAQALVKSWDPTGARRTVRIGAFIDFRPLAAEIKAELESALGLTVQLDFGEQPNIGAKASRGDFDVFISAGGADFDSPENWFANVDSKCHAGMANPQFQSLVAASDEKLPVDALGGYKKANQLLADAAACPALVYLQALQLVKPWITGAGGNGLYEYYWTGISVLKH